MKNTFTNLFALTVFAMVTLTACDNAVPRLNRVFIGEWKRIDKADSNLVIKKENDGIVVICGRQKTAALYDNNKKALKIYYKQDTIAITYNEKTDNILIDNGDDGEFKRVE